MASVFTRNRDRQKEYPGVPQPMIFKQLLFVAAIALAACASAQTGRTIVTVERKAGNKDAVQQENVLVFEAGKRAPILVWQPCLGSHAGLQLLILMDDSAASGLGNQIADLRTFVQALPDATAVGVGYMQNGRAAMVQDFTTDHSLAAKAIRIPRGARGGGSPFFTLSDVTRRWPGDSRGGRREILMITDGVDRYADQTFNPDNPNVTSAIHDAQRAETLVYTIYFRGAGRADADPATAVGGQNYLTEVSDETGGKFLSTGTLSPVSFTPMLNELANILNNQYELVFQSKAKPRDGLVQLKLKMETRGIRLVAPTLVPVSQKN